MKKILSLLLMSFMIFAVMAVVVAEENVTNSTDDTDDLELPEAKKTGAWSNFRDRMKLAFTFNKEKKIDIALNIAEKKLAYIESIAADDPEKAEKLMEEYEAYLARAEEYAAKLEEAKTDNPNMSLSGIEKMIRAQARIELHREKAEAMYLRALEHLEASNASDEKIARFEGFYAREVEKLDEMEARFLEKKENAKVKYKVLSGENETEVEMKIRFIENKEGLVKYRVEREIRMKILLEGINLTDEQKTALEANLERFEEQRFEYERRFEIRDDGEIRERIKVENEFGEFEYFREVRDDGRIREKIRYKGDFEDDDDDEDLNESE